MGVKNEGSCIVYSTEKLAHQHAQSTTFRLLAAVGLFGLTCGFHIHFYSSKVSFESLAGPA